MRNLWVATAGLGLVFGASASSLYAESENKATSEMQKLENKASDVYQDAKASVFDLLDKNSVEVKFETGSSLLSDSAKSDIKALMDSIKKGSEIESVSIAVWADAEAPLVEGQELSSEQTDLAAKRADNLQQYVESLGKTEVDTYDMSKRVSWFAELLQTDDAVAKKTMADDNTRAEGAEDRMVSAKARVFKDKGGASQAVIIAIRDKAELSH